MIKQNEWWLACLKTNVIYTYTYTCTSINIIIIIINITTITATLSLKEKWDIFFMGDLWFCEAILHSSQPQKTTSSWWTLNEVHLRSTTHTVLDLTGINFKSSKNVFFFHFKDSNHNIIIFCTCLWWLDVWYLDFEIKIPCRLISNFLHNIHLEVI